MYAKNMVESQRGASPASASASRKPSFSGAPQSEGNTTLSPKHSAPSPSSPTDPLSPHTSA
eukprot:CAMPEP_0114265194 /NCGR_PEP_ID=MMETSP0058-20121206/23738_1 /TAXON_ID=36894 /ORGANISM="Pyramimonas parkeae, CCMP726" /LENGTH=60 /DNA_ID=CAMNT_0001382175 /DNA_START=10 /DNA_END=188 /DNA_ORIENTATION=-